MNNPVSKVSVALGAPEINIVNQVSDERGFYNFSLSLRTIIREWSATHPTTNNGNGHDGEEQA